MVLASTLNGLKSMCMMQARYHGAAICNCNGWCRGQRQEHVVFVGVPEESAVLPLKALAQEMIARGYRASLALPHGFKSW